jgi:hypothetical protein
VIDGEAQNLGSSPASMLGCDELAAEDQRVEHHAAGPDVVLVRAELREQRAEIRHAPVVDATQSLRDVIVAPGPVADGRNVIASSRAWAVRPAYRAFIAPFIYLSAKGSGNGSA